MCSVCYLVKYPDSLVLMNQFGNYYSRLFLSCYDIQSPNVLLQLVYIYVHIIHLNIQECRLHKITGSTKIKPHFQNEMVYDKMKFG